MLLARDIAQSTSATNTDDIRGIPEAADTMGIDRLWRYDGEMRQLVAVKGSTVYCMSLDGGYTTDDMLRALLRKIS